jgi:hypothetical protein
LQQKSRIWKRTTNECTITNCRNKIMRTITGTHPGGSPRLPIIISEVKERPHSASLSSKVCWIFWCLSVILMM